MIPLSTPTLAGNEWQYVKRCLDTGWISSAGEFVTQFENDTAKFAGAKYGVAVANGTCALHLALIGQGVGPDDIVILPNLTFVASANSVRYVGAEPVFIDVELTHWQMDLSLLERFLAESCEMRDDGRCYRRSDSKRVGYLMPVHTLGDMGNIEQLLMLAKRFGLIVIEDSSEALGTTFRGKSAGSFGAAGVFSFNGNKIISTGGGGVVVSDDEEFSTRVRHLSVQAKTSAFEYQHDEVGFNYRMPNVLAALGVAQLEQLPGFLSRKRSMAGEYRTQLRGVGDVSFPATLDQVDSNAWLNTLRTEMKGPMLERLEQNEVQARPFWIPMNQLPMYKAFSYVNDTDNTARLYAECVSIPSSADLSEEDLDRVCEVIRGCF